VDSGGCKGENQHDEAEDAEGDADEGHHAECLEAAVSLISQLHQLSDWWILPI